MALRGHLLESVRAKAAIIVNKVTIMAIFYSETLPLGGFRYIIVAKVAFRPLLQHLRYFYFAEQHLRCCEAFIARWTPSGSTLLI